MNRPEMLKMFISEDDLRPAMMNPWTWEGQTGATNGHIMILLPGVDAEYKPCELGIRSVLTPEVEGIESIDVKSLCAAIERIPKVERLDPEEVECETCDGEGEYECFECGSEVHCDDCDGKGKVTKNVKPTGIFIPDDNAKMIIDKVPFSVRYLKKILVVAQELNVAEINHKTGPEPARGHWFMVGEARVLLMPMRLEPEADEHIVTYRKLKVSA